MRGKWREVHLGDVAEIVMGQSPPGSTYNESGDGLPFFQGVKDFGYRNPTPRVFCSRPSRVAQLGDILFSVRAPIGRVNIADRECTIGRGLSIIQPRDKADSRYIEFALRYLEPTWQAIEGGGSVFGNATRQDVELLSLTWPDEFSDRRIIAEVLGSLDDKIELNRRMNATLESMARAVFRQWFVESEEAKGWEVKPLDEIAVFLNGLALQKYPPESDEFLPVIKIAQLRKNSTKDADKASTNLDPAYIVDDGDVLFSWSGSLEVVIWCGGKGALNQHLFKVTSAKFPKWFYYLWTKHHLSDFQQIAAGKATTMGHIQRHHLSQALAIVPPPETLRKMTEQMSPIIDLYINNAIQSRTLAVLKDALLPRLMSGEVRVKEVEGVI